jgi:hypothetical protein
VLQRYTIQYVDSSFHNLVNCPVRATVQMTEGAGMVVQRYVIQNARVTQAQQEKGLHPATEKGLEALINELFSPSQVSFYCAGFVVKRRESVNSSRMPDCCAMEADGCAVVLEASAQLWQWMVVCQRMLGNLPCQGRLGQTCQ